MTNFICDNRYERVFRIRKGYRLLGITGLLVSVAILVMGVVGMWRELPPDRRLLGIAVVVVGWGFFCALSIWILLAYWRETLTLRASRVIQQGVIASRECDLAEVHDLRWAPTSKGGRVVLRTPRTKIGIWLENFEIEDRLSIIEYLRRYVPKDVQHGWERFCYLTALPLRKRKNFDADQELEPGQVRLTRRRWDWYFVPAIVVFAGLGVLLYLLLDQPRLLAAPLAPAAFWLLMRFTTPKQGLVSERIRREELGGFVSLLILCLGSYLGSAAAIAVCRLAGLPAWLGPTLAILVLLGCLIAVVIAVFRMDQRRKQREQKEIPAAVQEWDVDTEL
jgi:hypothetical protein